MDKIGKIIKHYVDSPEYTNGVALMKQGVDYYNQNNTAILKREMNFYTEKGKSCKDPYKSNNKLTSGWMKLLTKQKVNYSINKKLSLETDAEEQLINTIGTNYRNVLKKLCIETSKKGVGYYQVYIENGLFKYKIIPSEQIIVIPYRDNKDSIEYVIRVFSENVTDSSGKIKNVKKTQFWTNEVVYYYEYSDSINKNLWELEDLPYNPEPHITKTLKYGAVISKTMAHSWGKPPFCVLYNNDERATDLQPIKKFIDVYDIVASDFANNLEDFQDVYWILKNYGGEDFDEVMSQIKQYKVVATGEDGDATTETIDIPVEARKVMLELIESLIYKFGMGVNVDKMTSNVTNPQIYALFHNLNLKANDFETEVLELWQQLMYFVNMFYSLTSQTLATSSLVFNREIILNENE